MSNSDEQSVERRLRAADPAPSGRALLISGRDLADLVEATMSQDLMLETTPMKPRRAWPLIGLAATVIAALLTGGIYLLARGGDARHNTAAGPARSVLTLSLPTPPSGPTMRTCRQVTVETLEQIGQVAFSGTVISSEPAAVTIAVDHWYRGGNADEVRLAVPDPSVPTTAEGSVELSVGHRYLVTANDGVVSTCGFTTEWSADAAATFRAAFKN